MFHSIAFEVVVGLIFIYLLYSLLATVLSEMISVVLGLRARNLKEAISHMLNDEKIHGFFRRLLDSVRIARSPANEVVDSFYQNHEIKYLGGTGLFRKPSFIRPASFSKALVDELSGNGPVTAEKINTVLRTGVPISIKGNAGGVNKGALGPETAAYVLGLWENAAGDLARFRQLLEEWFNTTMEQATEWYKREIQLVLLVLGFFMAWFFCADTFVMVQKLSGDKHAREQMVSLAAAYIQSHPASADTSLMEIKKQLDADIASANSVLGLGSWLPDRVRVNMHPVTREKSYSPGIDPDCLSATHRKISNGTLSFTFAEKLGYFFRLAYHHFFGFLITAIAISLGAPFWFDLLNKVMKLRTSAKSQSGRS